MLQMESVPAQIKRLVSAVFRAVGEEIQSGEVEFIAVFAGFLLLFLGLQGAQKYLKRKIKNHRIKIIIYLMAPVLFLLAACLAREENPESSLFLIIFYLAGLWLAWDVIQQILDSLKAEKRKILVISFFLICVSAVLIIFLALAELNAPDLVSQFTSAQLLLNILIKIFIVIALAVFLWVLLPALIEKMGEKTSLDTRKKRVASSTKNIVIFLFAALSLLWITGIIEFGVRVLIGITVLVILMSLHAYISYRIEWVEKHLFSGREWEENEKLQIRRHLKRTSFWIVIILFIKIGRYTFGLEKILEGMRDIAVVQVRDLNLSLFNLVWGIILFALSLSLLFLFAKYLNMVATRYSGNPATGTSVESLIRNLGFLIVLVLFGYTIGVTWGLLIPIAGAIGIGVGFGLQAIINNYISGFVLLVSNKVRIGDVIELPGNAGRVLGIHTDTIFGRIKAIDMFSTIVVTNDNIDVSVPNSELITNKIINYTHSSNYIRMRISFGVSYGSDVELVEKCAREVIQSLDYVVQERKNDVWFSGYGDSSLDFIALCWVTLEMGYPPQKIQSDFLYRLWFKLKENNVEIPFPQRDVWFKSPLKIESDFQISSNREQPVKKR